MRIYLAGIKSILKHYKGDFSDHYILSSFYEYKSGKYPHYVLGKNHLLDSGAFTFMRGKTANWDDYVSKYIKFIKETNQTYFFELDIDVVVGIKKVEKFRDRIEQAIGKPTIPVWHKSRGLDYWYYLIENYNYIAIGGLVTAHIKPSEYIYLQKLVEIANKENVKVHGLGFTKMKWLPKIKWFSVDSTTWLNAHKYGELQWFDGRIIKKQQAAPLGMQLKESRKVEMLISNYEEWIKFQKYANLRL